MAAAHAGTGRRVFWDVSSPPEGKIPGSRDTPLNLFSVREVMAL